METNINLNIIYNIREKLDKKNIHSLNQEEFEYLLDKEPEKFHYLRPYELNFKMNSEHLDKVCDYIDICYLGDAIEDLNGEVTLKTFLCFLTKIRLNYSFERDINKIFNPKFLKEKDFLEKFHEAVLKANEFQSKDRNTGVKAILSSSQSFEIENKEVFDFLFEYGKLHLNTLLKMCNNKKLIDTLFSNWKQLISENTSNNHFKFKYLPAYFFDNKPKLLRTFIYRNLISAFDIKSYSQEILDLELFETLLDQGRTNFIGHLLNKVDNIDFLTKDIIKILSKETNKLSCISNDKKVLLSDEDIIELSIYFKRSNQIHLLSLLDLSKINKETFEEIRPLINLLDSEDVNSLINYDCINKPKDLIFTIEELKPLKAFMENSRFFTPDNRKRINDFQFNIMKINFLEESYKEIFNYLDESGIDYLSIDLANYNLFKNYELLIDDKEVELDETLIEDIFTNLVNIEQITTEELYSILMKFNRYDLLSEQNINRISKCFIPINVKAKYQELIKVLLTKNNFKNNYQFNILLAKYNLVEEVSEELFSNEDFLFVISKYIEFKELTQLIKNKKD